MIGGLAHCAFEGGRIRNAGPAQEENVVVKGLPFSAKKRHAWANVVEGGKSKGRISRKRKKRGTIGPARTEDGASDVEGLLREARTPPGPRGKFRTSQQREGKKTYC